MSEYYLIYRTEKGKPKSATHATPIEGTLTLELVKAIENELQKRYGNDTFDVILYKKEKLSVSDALKLSSWRLKLAVRGRVWRDERMKQEAWGHC